MLRHTVNAWMCCLASWDLPAAVVMVRTQASCSEDWPNACPAVIVGAALSVGWAGLMCAWQLKRVWGYWPAGIMHGWWPDQFMSSECCRAMRTTLLVEESAVLVTVKVSNSMYILEYAT